MSKQYRVRLSYGSCYMYLDTVWSDSEFNAMKTAWQLHGSFILDGVKLSVDLVPEQDLASLRFVEVVA